MSAVAVSSCLTGASGSVLVERSIPYAPLRADLPLLTARFLNFSSFHVALFHLLKVPNLPGQILLYTPIMATIFFTCTALGV